MRALIGFFVILTLIAPCVYGSDMRISCDSIGGAFGPPNGECAMAGTVLKFCIRYTNTSDTGWNVANALVISSPDGATWNDSAHGNFRGSNLGPIGIDTTGSLSKALFPTVYQLRTFSSLGVSSIFRADGISPDTVVFSGAGNDYGMGLPPQTDVRNYIILIQTKMADCGKTVCIDSAMRHPPTGVWKWSALYPTSGETTPAWSGRRCVNLVCPCMGTVGNVDCDSMDMVDIADLTALVDHLFVSFTPLCSWSESNCDGNVNGNIDMGDVTALIQNLFLTFTPLPACQ